MEAQKLSYLLTQYFNNACTESEWQELFAVMNDASQKEVVQAMLASMMQDDASHVPAYDDAKWQHVLDEVLAAGKRQSEPAFEQEEDANHVVPMYSNRRRLNWKWVAAACVFLLLASAAVFKFFVSPNTPIKDNQVAAAGKVIRNDHAVLTLADGSTIILDSAKNGEVGTQGNTKIIKLSQGQLAYKGNNSKGHNQYNTVSTPIGVQYQLLLPDGTAVWLNAASSLRFPVVFDGAQREVTLTGEGYFEVAKLKSKPFVVHARGTDVQVLGTHFNVMAYDDEAVLKTTLLEGKVKVVAGNGNDALLAPRQQAQYVKDNVLKVKSNVDTDEVMAWKNNYFYFRDADVETIMRQLARWYDINVVFKEKVRYLFYAEIPHNQDLSAVLKALSLTGNVHFDVKGNNVTVTR